MLFVWDGLAYMCVSSCRCMLFVWDRLAYLYVSIVVDVCCLCKMGYHICM